MPGMSAGPVRLTVHRCDLGDPSAGPLRALSRRSSARLFEEGRQKLPLFRLGIEGAESDARVRVGGIVRERRPVRLDRRGQVADIALLDRPDLVKQLAPAHWTGSTLERRGIKLHPLPGASLLA